MINDSKANLDLAKKNARKLSFKFKRKCQEIFINNECSNFNRKLSTYFRSIDCFKTLVDDFKKNKKKYFFVNTVEKDGKRDLLSRSFDYITIILKLLYILLFKKTVVVYHILSSNKIGFFRDFLIINISFIFRKKIILHSHNGNYNIFFKSCSVSLQKVISSTINKADKIILLSKRLTNTFFFVNDKKN